MNKKKNFILVIPARMKSSRLPGKPLLLIKGLPMIIRTCRQCAKAISKNLIYVATDNKKIKKKCEEYGFNSIITKKKCLTGTDRVAEIAKKIIAKYYINIQGDEPIFDPKDILKLVKMIKKTPKDVLLGYAKIKKMGDYFNPNKPKVLFDREKNLIYAYRKPTQLLQKLNIKKKKPFRGVWAYCFPREKLILFSKLNKKTPLEEKEDIEILRFLELGINVKVVKMSEKSYAVDVKKDIKKVEGLLSNGRNN